MVDLLGKHGFVHLPLPSLDCLVCCRLQPFLAKGSYGLSPLHDSLIMLALVALSEPGSKTTVLAIILRTAAALVALYAFLLGLDLMGSAFLVLGSKGAGELFASTDNPVSGLMVGVMATVLVQSSSTSTSIVVGLVGAGQVSVRDAIPVIMGANVGTSVTNTIVSMVHARSAAELEYAFAGAVLHDIFNLLTVLTVLPTEAIVAAISGEGGPLYRVSKAVTEATMGTGARDVTFTSPTKSIVAPLTRSFLDPNKDVLKALSLGAPVRRHVPLASVGQCPRSLNCAEYSCVSSSMQRAWEKVDPDGLSSIAKCNHFLTFADGCAQPADCYLGADKFYRVSIEGGRTLNSGMFARIGDVPGGIMGLLLSFVLIAASLFCLVKVLHALVIGQAKRMIMRAIRMNDYIALFVGFLMTLVIQSSSVTTSTLIPLCAMGILPIHKMLPLTLGANLGTTCTSIFAALAVLKFDSLHIAFCHLFFNSFGVLLWFPVPLLRELPVRAACQLGFYASCWRLVPLIYVLTVFVACPAVGLAISLLYRVSLVGGVIVTALLVMSLVVFVVWWWRGGCYYVVSQEVRRERAERRRRELAEDSPKESRPRPSPSTSTQKAELAEVAKVAEVAEVAELRDVVIERIEPSRAKRAHFEQDLDIGCEATGAPVPAEHVPARTATLTVHTHTVKEGSFWV